MQVNDKFELPLTADNLSALKRCSDNPVMSFVPDNMDDAVSKISSFEAELVALADLKLCTFSRLLERLYVFPYRDHPSDLRKAKNEVVDELSFPINQASFKPIAKVIDHSNDQFSGLSIFYHTKLTDEGIELLTRAGHFR